jgi:hypothetical protein
MSGQMSDYEGLAAQAIVGSTLASAGALATILALTT